MSLTVVIIAIIRTARACTFFGTVVILELPCPSTPVPLPHVYAPPVISQTEAFIIIM